MFQASNNAAQQWMDDAKAEGGSTSAAPVSLHGSGFYRHEHDITQVVFTSYLFNLKVLEMLDSSYTETTLS